MSDSSVLLGDNMVTSGDLKALVYLTPNSSQYRGRRCSGKVASDVTEDRRP